MRLGDFKYMFAARGSRRLRGSDIGLRVLAVVLAIGLWIFVNAGERGSVATLTVPISYASLPQGMVIVNHPPTAGENRSHRSAHAAVAARSEPADAPYRSAQRCVRAIRLQDLPRHVQRRTKYLRDQHLARSIVAGCRSHGYARRAGPSGSAGPGRARLHDFVGRYYAAQRHRGWAQPLCGAAHCGQHGAFRSEGTYVKYRPFG